MTPCVSCGAEMPKRKRKSGMCVSCFVAHRSEAAAAKPERTCDGCGKVMARPRRHGVCLTCFNATKRKAREAAGNTPRKPVPDKRVHRCSRCDARITRNATTGMCKGCAYSSRAHVPHKHGGDVQKISRVAQAKKLFAQGMTISEISSEMAVSYETVRRYLCERKAGARATEKPCLMCGVPVSAPRQHCITCSVDVARVKQQAFETGWPSGRWKACKLTLGDARVSTAVAGSLHLGIEAAMLAAMHALGVQHG